MKNRFLMLLLGISFFGFAQDTLLVPIDSVADKSNTPTSKFVILKLKKHQAATAVA